jgi:hypothetical protein
MKSKTSGRRQRTADEWRSILRRQAESGLTIKEFCERETVCEQNFFRQRKKLGTEAPVVTGGFVELKRLCSEAAVRVELQLPNGAILRIA